MNHGGMKLKQHHIALLFLVISLPVLSVLYFKVQVFHKMAAESFELDYRLQSAVDNGILYLTKDEEGSLIFDKETAIKRFFLSLYAAFGVTMDLQKQEMLQLYVPVIAVILPDGFYFSYCEAEKNSQTQKVVRKWSEKILCSYEDKLVFSETFISKFEYYIEQHNQIAANFGIRYQFYVPSIDTSDLQRAITGSSLIVVFQGYPFSSGGFYNRVNIAGAQIYKKQQYIIIPEEWYQIYHFPNCEKVDKADNKKLCYSVKECSKLGAFPCDKCFPEWKLEEIQIQ